MDVFWSGLTPVVLAARKYYAPGIIGPFTLQTCVDKDMDFYIYDVAPRIGGGTCTSKM